jgi:prepilin-type N-terminal cleavage/methylation domain-containing protein
MRPVRFVRPIETSRSGFTLLEILLALLVLGILGGALWKMLIGDRKRYELTRNLFSAIQVATKINEDLWEEARTHATLIELTQEFPELVSNNLITDSESPFFRYVFDRKEPYGLIQQGVDQGILREDGVLYDQLGPFKCQVEIVRHADIGDPEYGKHLAQILIKVTWQEKDGMTRTYTLPTLLPSSAGPVPLDKLPEDETRTKTLARDFLFPGNQGRSFEQAATIAGCDVSLAEDVGRIHVFIGFVNSALASLTQEIDSLKNEQAQHFVPSCVGVVKPQFQICRKLESGASLAFHFLTELAPSVRRVSEAPPTNLRGIPSTAVGMALTNYQSLFSDFFRWLHAMRRAIDWIEAPEFLVFLSHREQEWIRIKSLETYRLFHSLGEIPSEEFREFLSRQRARVKDRNHFLEKMYLRDESLQPGTESFRRAFPNLVAICERMDREIRPAASSAALFSHNVVRSSEED